MPLIKSSSKKAFKKNIETEMDANPEKKDRKQNIAIAYSVQRQAKKKKMALGGAVESETHSKAYSRNPGTPAPKPDDERLPKDEYMAGDMDAPIGSTPRGRAPTIGKNTYDNDRFTDRMALGGAVEGPTHSKSFNQNPGTPGKKPDDERFPQSEYMASDMDAPPGSTPHGDMVTISKAEYDALRSGGAYAHGGMAHKRPKGPMNPKLAESKMGEMMDGPSSIADAIMEKKHRMAEGGMVDLEENSEEEGSTPYDRMNAEAGGAEQYDDSQLEAQPEGSNEDGDEREDEEENKHDMISQIRMKMKSRRG